MKKVTKLMLESWVNNLEGEEQKYLKSKLREKKKKKLATIIVDWFPEIGTLSKKKL